MKTSFGRITAAIVVVSSTTACKLTFGSSDGTDGTDSSTASGVAVSTTGSGASTSGGEGGSPSVGSSTTGTGATTGGAGGAGGGAAGATSGGAGGATSGGTGGAASTSTTSSGGNLGVGPFASPICGMPSTPPSNGDCYTPVMKGCNPVTGSPCAVDEACDFSATVEFECYPGDNSVQLCGSCDPLAGQYCENGLECLPIDLGDLSPTVFQCFKFCCSDADCGGAAGSCSHDIYGGSTGLCAAP